MSAIFKSKLNLILAIGSVGILMLSFQNCSKYQYAATDLEGFNKTTSAPLDTDHLPDGVYIQISDDVADEAAPDMAAPSDPTSVSSDSPITNTDSDLTIVESKDPSTPAVVNPIARPIVEQPVVEPKKEQTPVVINPIAKNDDDDSDDEKKDKKDKKEHDDHDYSKICEKHAGKHSRNIAQEDLAGEASGLRGMLVLNQDNIDDLKSIDDFKGRLVLCDVDMDKITNTKGSVVLVNSEVKEICEHKGNIKIIGDSRAEISKSNVEIQVKRRSN